MNKKKDVEAEE